MLVEDTDDYLLSLVQDSTVRQNSKFEQSMLRAKEELAKAEQEEAMAKETLAKAKEQVLIFGMCMVSMTTWLLCYRLYSGRLK